MPATAFDQCRRFATDAYGLERLLRLAQSSVQVFLSFILTSSPQTLVLNKAQALNLRRGLTSLKGQLGLVRRFFRLFRFLDAFTSSYRLFTLPAPADKVSKDTESVHLERTLDALAAAFNGGYLFLETITIVDALGIPEIAIWGPAADHALKVESQRCWFLALAAGALANVLRLQKNSRQRIAQSKRQPKEAMAEKSKEQSKEHEATVRRLNAERGRILRKMAACCLDLALPGSVIGWIPASPGTTGVLMFATSLLTGLDVWERCGKEVGRA